jgi:hypothetical protein
MRFRNAFGACGAAVLVTVSVTPSAFAADHSMHTEGDVIFPGQDHGGTMWFNEYGDVVTVCDRDADGFAAKLIVYTGEVYGSQRYTSYATGDGDCTTRKASMGGVYNLPENRTIGFLLCLTKNGSDGYCNAANWYNDH